MIIKVIKPLNTRIGGAGTTYKKGVVRRPDEEIEVVKKVLGESINDNNTWYFDGKEKFYWSGGVKQINSGDNIMKIVNYNLLFEQIYHEYSITKGKNCKVAVLDSGIALNHPAFDGAIVGQNISSNSLFGITDKTGHGTHCAGIIGARKGEVIGIAPECQLFISKVATDKGNIFVEEVIKGLKWAINNKVDVVNMSFGISEKNNKEIQALIDEAYSKNIILVASAGENNILKTEFLYPAMYDKCIAVGAIDSSFQYNVDSPFSSHLNFVLPYTDVFSCGIQNNYVSMKGSSMSTAFVSGMICLIKASYELPEKVGCDEIILKLQKKVKCLNIETDYNNPLQLIKI